MAPNKSDDATVVSQPSMHQFVGQDRSELFNHIRSTALSLLSSPDACFLVIALGTLRLCDPQRRADLRFLRGVLIVAKWSMPPRSTMLQVLAGADLVAVPLRVAGCQMIFFFF